LYSIAIIMLLIQTQDGVLQLLRWGNSTRTQNMFGCIRRLMQ